MAEEKKETHTVTTPNKPKAVLMPIVQFKTQLAGDYQKTVSNYFEGDKEKSMKFMSAVVRSVQKVPKLLDCDRESLMTSFMCAAEYRLYPSSVSGEAYVLPYKGKAQFQLGYQGIITLLYRAGVSSVRTSIVFQNDEFQYEEGLEPILIHKPAPFGTAKGEAIGCYGVAVVNGTQLYKVLSKDEILKFKEFSQAKGSEFSPWNSKNDPELHMWRKTVIKQLAKTLPKNDEIMSAIAKDNEESIIAARQNNLNASGVATGRALHAPVDGEESQEVPDTEKTIS